MGGRKITDRQKARNERRNIGKNSRRKHKPRSASRKGKNRKSAVQMAEWYDQLPSVPRIWVSRESMEGFIKLAESNDILETGGFLIGNIYRDTVSDGVIAVVEDIFSDGKFGSRADYVFGLDMQMSCYTYMKGKYGPNAHIIGTIHSHAQFEAFYSDTDYRMMNSRTSDEVHLVVSPSHKHYVATYKDRDFKYHHDAELMPDSRGPVLAYGRKRL